MAVAVDSTNLRPALKLGAAALWLNWYHGGVTMNTAPRMMFIIGLAWGPSTSPP